MAACVMLAGNLHLSLIGLGSSLALDLSSNICNTLTVIQISTGTPVKQ